jgi:uncharacterized membrane protein
LGKSTILKRRKFELFLAGFIRIKSKKMFDNPIFLIPFITGLVFIITGIILFQFPPKKINGFYGYRTFSSMKSQERWDFAQLYAAKELIKSGIILTVLSLIGWIYNPAENTGVVLGMGILISILVILIYKVESAIKNKFK